MAKFLVETFPDLGKGEDMKVIALTEDVRPVVRGKWKRETKFNLEWVCSECGGVAWFMKDENGKPKRARTRFCPNCGADMREVEE